MIPESDPHARKLVQLILQDDERLVWAGKPSLRAILFSEAPLLLLGVGFYGLFLSIVGFYRLDPLIGWKCQFNQDYRAIATLFTGTLSLLCLSSWPLLSLWMANAAGIYAITTKRVLRINRKSRDIIWAQEGPFPTAVSIVSSQSGHGSVCVKDEDSSNTVEFIHLDNLPMIATLVAETFGIPFDNVTSYPLATTQTKSKSEEVLAYLYSPVGERRGLVPTLASIGLWLAYLIVIWFWLGSIQNTIGLGTSWILISVLVVFTVAMTGGLLLQLKKCWSSTEK